MDIIASWGRFVGMWLYASFIGGAGDRCDISAKSSFLLLGGVVNEADADRSGKSWVFEPA